MRLVIVAILIAVAFAAPGWAADAVSLDDARIKALADSDAKAQQAAIQQLVEAGPGAIPALTAVVDRNGPADLKPALQAILAIASRQYADNQRKEVSSRLAAELAEKHTPQTRREICRLLGLVGGSECVDPLYKLLVDPDVREAARQALVRMPSRAATQALVAGLQITEEEFRVALVDAIGERKDAAALPILRSLAIGPNEALSRSAMNGLSRIPAPAAIVTLVEATEAGKPGALTALLALSDTLAEEGIPDIPGQSMIKAFTHALDRGDLPVEMRARIIRALGYRRDTAVFDVLLKASNDADVNVRAAAFKAMGRLGSEKAFDRLLVAVGQAAGPDRDAAEQAMIALSGDTTNARMRAAYEKATDAQKAPLLRVLANRHAPEVGPLLLNEARSESTEIRAAVAAGLARIADPQHESTLMQLAEKGPAEVTRAAVTGLLEIAQKQEKTGPSKAAGLYSKLYALALTPQQTNAALEGLSRTAGPQDIAMLDVVFPLLGEEEIPPEACHAAARLAMQLPEDRRQEAIETLEASATLLGKDPMLPRIIEYLWKIGSQFDPSHEAGFITSWWLVGPFKLHGQKAWNECHFADARPDPRAKAAIDGQEYEWKKVHTPESNGVVPLARILGPGDGAGAYAYTEITVDATQRVRCLVGSDDGVVVWLNGKRVLAVLEDRALTVDQDRIDVDLVAGVNRVLVKSLNTFGGWAFCLRLTDPAGQPLPFRQPP